MRFLLMLIFLSIAFSACDNKMGGIKMCDSLKCYSWEVCNELTDSCDLKAGYCNEDSECTEGHLSICDTSTHLCKAEGAYVLPIGIPAPSFGIEENHEMYEGELFVAGNFIYKDAGNGPYTHYVDNTSPNCNDSNVDGYGDETSPLCKIPQRNVPAGSVIEVHGQYDVTHSSPSNLQNYQGTKLNPIFIRGVGAKITGGFNLIDFHYVIIEDIVFEDRDGDLSEGSTGYITITDKDGIRYDSDYVVIRNNDISGNLKSGGVGVGGYSSETVIHDILILNNKIHHNGDWQADFDQDNHGIALRDSYNVWVLDNEMSYNSGDGIQVNGGSNGYTALHHIYVGRNLSHHNKQAGFWSKQASDVIFSQNIAHSHVASGSSTGQCAGMQYAPNNIWYIYNKFYNCEIGIIFASNSVENPGQNQYIIGNLIYNIHNSKFDTENSWSGAAISLWGGVDVQILNNVIYDYDGGIYSPKSSGNIVIKNNIFSAAQTGSEMFLYNSSLIQNADIDNNLYNSSGSFRVGGSGNYSFRELQTTYNHETNGLGSTDPLFTDPSSGDFSLQALSPAINAGVRVSAYQTFQDLYGLDILIDFDGNPRPQEEGWDIGAYEY